MNITLIAVGKIKEQFLLQALEEYKKRLSRYCTLKIIEIPDEKAPENLSKAEMTNILEKEAAKIVNKIPSGSTVISLEIEANQMTSEKFAETIENYGIQGVSHLCFIIGGSLGLGESIKRISELNLSFSKMTFPHQMFRVMVLEQVYRSFRIIRGEPYHK